MSNATKTTRQTPDELTTARVDFLVSVDQLIRAAEDTRQNRDKLIGLIDLGQQQEGRTDG